MRNETLGGFVRGCLEKSAEGEAGNLGAAFNPRLERKQELERKKMNVADNAGWNALKGGINEFTRRPFKAPEFLGTRGRILPPSAASQARGAFLDAVGGPVETNAIDENYGDAEPSRKQWFDQQRAAAAAQKPYLTRAEGGFRNAVGSAGRRLGMGVPFTGVGALRRALGK